MKGINLIRFLFINIIIIFVLFIIEPSKKRRIENVMKDTFLATFLANIIEEKEERKEDIKKREINKEEKHEENKKERDRMLHRDLCKNAI